MQQQQYHLTIRFYFSRTTTLTVWHEKSDENLHAGRLKIRQWMKRAIQWFLRVRSNMFERYAVEKLLKRRYKGC